MNKRWITGITLTGTLLFLASCGSAQDAGNAEMKNIAVASESAENTSQSETKDTKENVSDEILSLLELGTYDDTIAFNGEERDEKEVLFDNGYCILPQCSLRSIACSTIMKSEQYADIAEEEARNLVKMLEETKLIREGKELKDYNVNPDDPAINATLKFVLLNSKGDYITLSLVAFKGDVVQVIKQGSETYYLEPNKSLTEKIKEYTKYQLLEKKELNAITSIEVIYESGESYVVPKEKMDRVKKLFNERVILDEARIGAYNTIVKATTKNNQEYEMKLYAKKSEMIIGDAAYVIPQELVEILMEQET